VEHRVPVRHHHGLATALGHRLDDLEQVLEPESGAQRGVGGRLDRRPVHHGVGVREADLHAIRTRVHRGGQQVLRLLDRRIARGQIADERTATLGARLCEQVVDAAHTSSTRLKYRAAVSTSLSPRPDRLTTMRPSGPSSRPRRSAPARAWEDSTAGMMPSVFDSSWKASIASASVTARYSARPMSLRYECSGPTPG